VAIHFKTHFLFLSLSVIGSNAFGLDASPQTVVPPTHDTATNIGPTTPSRVYSYEKPTFKNYLIPAIEIPIFQFTLNQADRLLYPHQGYDVTFASGWDHVAHGKWVVDQDDFTINQIGHPYQGTVYFTAARSSGLNFWESWIYSNAGSYLWETYGERSDPSINDQVASGTAGALLGEPLYRLCSLIMDGGGTDPGFLRYVAATLVSPVTMINRFMFGEKYGPTLESRDPEFFMRIDGGWAQNTLIQEPHSARQSATDVVMGKLSLDYGSPGRATYRYQRPFDYFHMDLGGIDSNGRIFDDLSVRGLLFGAKFENDGPLQGIWGLYGHFDYESPQIFRFSTTAVSFGTTSQLSMGKQMALQGTALAGLGYASAGTITPNNDQNDFHYGLTPQGLLSLRWLLGTRLSLDASGRTFYITDHYASRAPGKEKIDRLDTSLLLRLFGGHSISVGYGYVQRVAHYDALPSLSQRIGTVSVMYSYVSDMHLGRVTPDGK